MTRTLWSSIFVMTIFVSSAAADSDGYFCNAKGYIAYQFNGISVSTPGHTLHIIYLGGENGINPPIEFKLDDFQPHGMKCGEDTIEILGWDKIYIIEHSKGRVPALSKTVNTPKGKHVEGFTSGNLGYWSHEKQILLSSNDPQHLYELLIQKNSQSEIKNGYGIIHHRTKTEIVQKNLDNYIVKRFHVFQGTFQETID